MLAGLMSGCPASAGVVAANATAYFLLNKTSNHYHHEVGLGPMKEKRFYVLLTSLFVHTDSSHMTNNMIMYWMFAKSLETHPAIAYGGRCPIGNQAQWGKIFALYFATGVSGSMFFMLSTYMRQPAEIRDFINVQGSSAATYGMNACAATLWAFYQLRPETASAKGTQYFPALFAALTVVPHVLRRIRVAHQQATTKRSKPFTPKELEERAAKNRLRDILVAARTVLHVGAAAAILRYQAKGTLSWRDAIVADTPAAAMPPATAYALYIGNIILNKGIRIKIFREHDEATDHASHAGGTIGGTIIGMVICCVAARRNGIDPAQLTGPVDPTQAAILCMANLVLLARWYTSW